MAKKDEVIEGTATEAPVNAEASAEDVAKIINQIKEKKVLDIGCGHGSNAFILAQKGSYVTALDIDEERLSVARNLNNHKNINFIKDFHSSLGSVIKNLVSKLLFSSIAIINIFSFNINFLPCLEFRNSNPNL